MKKFGMILVLGTLFSPAALAFQSKVSDNAVMIACRDNVASKPQCPVNGVCVSPPEVRSITPSAPQKRVTTPLNAVGLN